MVKYYTIKTFGNDRGLSCAFRQWRAVHSHCSKIHGYSIGVEFTLSSETLDEKNWCYDYGNFKWVKQLLEDTFDHKTIISSDDPFRKRFEELEKAGVMDLVILPAVGCEKFAEFLFKEISPVIEKETSGRVKLDSVKVFEHGSNAATYQE